MPLSHTRARPGPIRRACLLLALGTAACAPASTDTGGGESETGTDTDAERCGPSSARVVEVIDGDTIVLAGGEKIRYLMVDTPEITNGKNECYGQEARSFNADYVLGQEVALTYDVECTDAYGRLLAYVEVPDGELNALLVARGYACVLNIPPNGEDRAAEFEALQTSAQEQLAGLWGKCSDGCGP